MTSSTSTPCDALGGNAFGDAAINGFAAQAADDKGDFGHIDVLYGVAVRPQRIRTVVIA